MRRESAPRASADRHRGRAVLFCTIAIVLALAAVIGLSVITVRSVDEDVTSALTVQPSVPPRPPATPVPSDPSTPEEPSPPAEEAPDVPVLARSSGEEVIRASGVLVPVPSPGPLVTFEGGPTRTFTVQAEEGLPGDPRDFALAVEEILSDQRGWAHGGEPDFQRVEGPGADIVVSLASPDLVDELCHPLDTAGEVSCTMGNHAIINQNRWVSGVPHFDGDLVEYRTYVINHEVGHTLGHGHVDCPAPGEPAPVMQQQTYGLQGCRANGWPHPGA